MNILFITHCHPGRTDFGAAQRSHLLWKALQNIGTVYTVYNVGPHDPNRQIDSRLLVAGVPFLSPILPVRLIQVLVARYFAPIEWPFRSMKYILGQIPWKEVSFDCVVTRYIKNAAQTSAWNIAPLCVDIDDLPSEVFSTVHAKKWPGIVGEFLKIVVAGWQRYILRKCAVSWIANPNQTKSIVDICPCFSLRNLAQGPSSKYLFYGCQKFQLMTVGLMGYEPNYQGVDWFLDNCWTLIRARFPSLIYVIAGGGTPDVLRDKWSTIPGVKLLGFVENLEALYESSLVVLAPIRGGSGTCIKVVEAALHGRRTIATPFAVRGLSKNDIDGLGMSVAETPADFLNALEMLFKEEEIATVQREIATRARVLNSISAFEECVRTAIADAVSGKDR